jgi:hypothetical protein
METHDELKERVRREQRLADAEEAQVEDAGARRARHRRRLAEPDPPPKRLTVREERAMLRALLDLPPSDRG